MIRGRAPEDRRYGLGVGWFASGDRVPTSCTRPRPRRTPSRRTPRTPRFLAAFQADLEVAVLEDVLRRRLGPDEDGLDVVGGVRRDVADRGLFRPGEPRHRGQRHREAEQGDGRAGRPSQRPRRDPGRDALVARSLLVGRVGEDPRPRVARVIGHHPAVGPDLHQAGTAAHLHLALRFRWLIPRTCRRRRNSPMASTSKA